jgi:glycosyltransferase involved in cell wall biosynthesis
MWKWIEKRTVPYFEHGYTVNKPIAEEFNKMYGCNYEVIRSIAVYDPDKVPVEQKNKFILYQGAVNEGRSFETLIPAMQWVKAPLIICGDGNFMQQAKTIVAEHRLNDKIQFKGLLAPEDLKKVTDSAYIGITLFEKAALSNYYSLANRFFDYIHAVVPQLCVNYPVYRELNNLYHVAVLIDDLDARNIAAQLNQLLDNDDQWKELEYNCREAAKVLNWQQEEIKLLAFYRNIFG